jgi:hypothetical protein
LPHPTIQGGLGNPDLPRNLTLTLPAPSAQIDSVLFKIWGETPTQFAHHAPPSGNYAWKVSTKSGEDQAKVCRKYELWLK